MTAWNIIVLMSIHPRHFSYERNIEGRDCIRNQFLGRGFKINGKAMGNYFVGDTGIIGKVGDPRNGGLLESLYIGNLKMSKHYSLWPSLITTFMDPRLELLSPIVFFIPF